MSQPRVMVTGGGGRTGRAILQALAKAGAAPHAFHRREEQRDGLLALGAVSTALGDLNDPASLARAAEGCDVVIHVGPPMEPREVEQTLAVLDAAAQGGAQRFIYYSVMHPLRREVRHHRLKLDAEEKVIESGMPYTIVQPMRYMQHLEPIWGQVTGEGVHAMPFDVDKRFNIVDLADLAAATAAVATQPGHLSATYELAGPEALSMRDVAQVLSEELGRPVTARAIPLDELARTAKAKGLSDDRVEQMVVMNGHYDAYGFLGNPNVLGWILGRAPGDFRSYVRRLIAAGR